MEFLSLPIQKRLLAEKDLDMKKAMELAPGMEAVKKQSSEFHATGGPVPTNQDIQFTTSYWKLLQMWRKRPSTREVLF